MNYISGELVQVGDFVWWNEYLATGRVVRILKSPDDFLSYGLDEPSILICYDGSNSYNGLFVAYPERVIQEGDEVCLISDEEASSISEVLLQASQSFGTDVSDATFGVFRCKDSNDKFVWKVIAYSGGIERESVFVEKT
ncbi:MAG: hypothetical protein JHC76_10045 [Akkermansiaceae bacterium]|jgi:hypothetical protein|nr:hypothetical protein [Akkermansiaceae bacterium]MBJ7396376.1 hypothetical protein [Akkermansiaceae bacterium]